MKSIVRTATSTADARRIVGALEVLGARGVTLSGYGIWQSRAHVRRRLGGQDVALLPRSDYAQVLKVPGHGLRVGREWRPVPSNDGTHVAGTVVIHAQL